MTSCATCMSALQHLVGRSVSCTAPQPQPDCPPSIHRTSCSERRFRVSFTRFRVSGHSLAIETGRWNRRGRGRLPVEERLCVCGQVQTEKHVVETCPVSRGVRQLYGLFRIEDLFNHTYNDEKTCKIIYDILKLYY